MYRLIVIIHLILGTPTLRGGDVSVGTWYGKGKTGNINLRFNRAHA